MKTIVCKFGGTSLASSGQMKKIRAILDDNTDRKFVVVSAPGKRSADDEKITDLLYASLKDDNAWNKVVTRFFSLERDLNLNHTASDYLIVNKKEILSSKDFAASRGEYCSALVFSSFIGWNFVDSYDFVRINDNGMIDDETYSLINEVVKNDQRYVIPGFYGKGNDNKVKTFSRGGSDITGAIVAKGVNADLYENWSDVSGVMAANPRIVDNPKIIDELSYDELELLASCGAEVFHHDAVAPVKYKIVINIKNTNSPSDKGTFIVNANKHKSVNPLAVSVKDKTVYVLGNNTVLEQYALKPDVNEKEVVNRLYKKYFG